MHKPVSDITLRKVGEGASIADFLRVPHVTQGHDPYWVASMSFEFGPLADGEGPRLNPKRHPWFQHGEAALFVALRDGVVLDAALKARLNDAIKQHLSPRFVPNEIFQVAEIPRTLTGKKQELPIKKLMLGQPLEKVVNQDAMANPGCLPWYVAFAQAHLARSA